jgi:hypothetical protein
MYQSVECPSGFVSGEAPKEHMTGLFEATDRD